MLISFFTLFADKLQFIRHNTDRGTLGPTYDQSALSQVVHMTRLMTSRVIRTIGMVCHMKAAEKEGVLSLGHRAVDQGKQDSLLDIIREAQFLVRLAAQSAADCIWKKTEDDSDVVDPLGILAGIYYVLKVQLTFSDLEFWCRRGESRLVFHRNGPGNSKRKRAASSDEGVAERSRRQAVRTVELVNEPLKTLIREYMPNLLIRVTIGRAILDTQSCSSSSQVISEDSDLYLHIK